MMSNILFKGCENKLNSLEQPLVKVVFNYANPNPINNPNSYPE